MKTTRDIALSCINDCLGEYCFEVEKRENATTKEEINTRIYYYEIVRNLLTLYHKIESEPCPENIINYGAVCGLVPENNNGKTIKPIYCMVVPQMPLYITDSCKTVFCTPDSILGHALLGRRTDSKRIKLSNVTITTTDGTEVIKSPSLKEPTVYNLVEFYRDEHDYFKGKKFPLNFYEDGLSL